MKSKVVDIRKYFEIPNLGLESYFARVRSGQSEEYRSTFYKGKPIERVLKDWNKRLGTIKSKWPSLYSFEKDLAKKVGPMSIMQPLDKRMDDIDHYYSLSVAKGKPLSSKAVQLCLREWARVSSSSVRLLSQRETVDNMKLSTNSGAPYFTKRRFVVDETLPVYCEVRGNQVVVTQRNKEWQSCAILGWRGQEGGPRPEDVKQRVVWMFPLGVNVCELQAYIPLINAFQFYNLVPAWNGNDYVDAEITKLFDTKGQEQLIICTDFSKFDQHFNQHLQDAAKQLIAGLLPDTIDSIRWLSEVFPIKYKIPLMYDYGKIVEGDHGMGSGSGGTNFDETLAHRCLQYDAAIRAGEQLNVHSMCLGDDGIVSWPGITVDEVVKSYTSHGLDMNLSKQYASAEDCVYLRRWHHRDYRVNGICVGVYSTMRALGHLLEQERYYQEWGPKDVALRQLSIIENVKYHPLREEFAKFCMRGDKYRLGLDIPGFLTNIQSEAERAIDLHTDFMGYTQSLGDGMSNINDWWIVKYLKSQR
nr:MAG: RNA-dependent RNA polymerase [Porcine picobirnavirus]